VAGFFNVPAKATAVVLNVTAVNPAGGGFLTVYPTGHTTPTTPNLNVTAKGVMSNLVEVAVGTGGHISIFASTQSDVVVDLQGYVSDTAVRGSGSGLYEALPSPVRICDTRPTAKLTGQAGQCNNRPLPAGGHVTVTVAATAFRVPLGAIAVVANVTAVASSGGGFLTVYAHGTARPTAFNVNYTAHQVIPNRVIATLPTSDCLTTHQVCGKIDVFSSQAANVIVDISGYYTGPSQTLAGAIFTPSPAPQRVCDTRAGNFSGLSGPAAQCNGQHNKGMALGPGKTLTVQIGGQFGVPSGATAAVLNVSAVNPTLSTSLTVNPNGSLPTTFDLYPPANGIERNLVVGTLSDRGSLSIWNRAGTVNVVVDLAGWYLAVPAPPTGLVAVPGLTRVMLNWTMPVSPGASPITGYNVFEGTSPGGETSTPLNGSTPINDQSFPVTGLTSGTIYYFTVKAVNALGGSVASNEALATPGWRTAGSAEPPVETWNAISCPTSGFCAAVGGSSGDTAMYQNGVWGSPQHIDTVTGSSPFLGLVSCSSSSFCAAVDQATQSLFTYNGTTWSKDATPPATPSLFGPVSCGAGSGFCMLADNGGNFFTTTDGVNWTAGAKFPANTTLEALSCLSSTSCLALMLDFQPTPSMPTATGYAIYAWNGTGWSAGASLPSNLTETDPAGGFSCSSSTQCVALFADDTGASLLYTYDGTAWSPSSLPGGYSPIFNFAPGSPLACAQGSDCFIMGLNGTTPGFFQDSGGSWTLVNAGAFQASSNPMSCGSATLCGALTGDHNVEVFGGPSWTLTPVGGNSQVQAVSCPTASFCAGVDNRANYLTFDGKSWSTPTAVKDSARTASSFSGSGAISCPAEASCAAMDSGHNLWRYTGGAWSSGEQTGLSGSFGQAGISCTTTGFCAVVSGPQASTYDPATGRWTRSLPDPDLSNANLESVSCVSSSFCVAVDESGYSSTWTGASWSAMTQFDISATGALPESVSCLTSTLCVASGGDGDAEIYSGASWSSSNPLDAGGLSNPACLPATAIRPAYCAVTGAHNAYYVENGDGSVAWTWSGAQSLPDNNGDKASTLGCGPSLCVATGTQNFAWKGTP
jgi:hypothetical protein